MAISIRISKKYSDEGWKVKIRDRERTEEPHLTLIKKTESWRVSLRSLEIMDTSPPKKDVPNGLLDEIRDGKKQKEIIKQWNKMYPENRV